jgi:hypothetical protein
VDRAMTFEVIGLLLLIAAIAFGAVAAWMAVR